MKKNLNKFRSGFTLMEVLIALGISAFLFTWVAVLYVNVVGSSGKIQLERELYENGRYVLERVVNEFRIGTVDYAEYWNKSRSTGDMCGENIYNGRGAIDPDYDVNNDGVISDYERERYSGLNGVYVPEEYDEYGNCHVHYEASFWTRGTIGSTKGRPEYISGVKNPVWGKDNDFELMNDSNDTAVDAQIDEQPDAIGDYVNWDGSGGNDKWQEELYLINAEGNEKTILRRRDVNGNKCYDVAEDTAAVINDDSVDTDTLNYCHIEMLKMDGRDTDNDGLIDTWSPAEGYSDGVDGDGDGFVEGWTTMEFVPISPPDIDVVDLRFFISPTEDPNFAFDEALIKQTHPHVTIIYSVQVNPQKTAMMSGTFPQMTVQTTVSSRVYYDTKNK